MTEQDKADIENELIDWFQAKGVRPSDGSMIMIGCIATQLVGKTKDIDQLQQAIQNIWMLLNIEVAREIEACRGSECPH